MSSNLSSFSKYRSSVSTHVMRARSAAPQRSLNVEQRDDRSGWEGVCVCMRRIRLEGHRWPHTPPSGVISYREKASPLTTPMRLAIIWFMRPAVVQDTTGIDSYVPSIKYTLSTTCRDHQQRCTNGRALGAHQTLRCSHGHTVACCGHWHWDTHRLAELARVNLHGGGDLTTRTQLSSHLDASQGEVGIIPHLPRHVLATHHEDTTHSTNTRSARSQSDSQIPHTDLPTAQSGGHQPCGSSSATAGKARTSCWVGMHPSKFPAAASP
jgi:hypothetical protein